MSCADTNIDILVSIIDGALVLEKDGRGERDGFRGSPFSVASNPSVPSNKLGSTRDREAQQVTLRKKPQGGNGVAGLGILRALDPHAVEPVNMNQQARERERDVGERREKKGFLGRDKEREKDREQERERDKERERERGRDRERYRRDEDSQAELTRMIGRCFSSGGRGSVTPHRIWGVILLFSRHPPLVYPYVFERSC